MIYTSLDLRFGWLCKSLDFFLLPAFGWIIFKGDKVVGPNWINPSQGDEGEFGPKTLLLIGVFPVQCLIIWTHITFLNCLLGIWEISFGIGVFFLNHWNNGLKQFSKLGYVFFFLLRSLNFGCCTCTRSFQPVSQSFVNCAVWRWSERGRSRPKYMGHCFSHTRYFRHPIETMSQTSNLWHPFFNTCV